MLVAAAGILSGFGQALTKTGEFFGALGESSDRRKYDLSVADYQKCLGANPSNVSACDGQRIIMESNAKIAAAAVTPGQSNNVNNRSSVNCTTSGPYWMRSTDCY